MRLLQGRRDEAERDIRQAIELQPDAYQGYVNLARFSNSAATATGP